MKSNLLSRMVQGAACALILSAIFPIAAMGQRRWRDRPSRNRIVVVSNYQRPYVINERRPRYSYRSSTYSTYGTYSYPQGYYGNQYSTYGSPGTYYTNRYYSYRYSQPYFANRYTYAWANPTYRYDESWYRQRHRRSGLRIGIRLR